MTDSNDKQWSDLIKDALEAKPTPDACERINDAVQDELSRQNSPAQEIFTFDEAAKYLRVTPNILEDYLEEIPCFELGGQLLFRKTALLEWISAREDTYRSNLNQYITKHSGNISIA